MATKNSVGLGLALTTAVLLLTACGSNGSGSTPTPPPTTTPTPSARTGTIYGQVLQVTATSVRPMTQIVEGPEFNASVGAGQQFDLKLPAASVVEGKYSSDLFSLNDLFAGCQITSATDVRVLPLNDLQTQSGEELKAVSFNGNKKTYFYWWFANKTANATVNGSCQLTTFNKQVLALQHGWNMVIWTTDGSRTILTVDAPTNERLLWTPTSINGQKVDADSGLSWQQLEKYKNR